MTLFLPLVECYDHQQVIVTCWCHLHPSCPMSTTSLRRGKEYYLLFKDLFSHKECIYFLKHKSKVFDHYKKYKAWLRVQRGSTIWIFGSDRGGEFTSQEFTEHLKNSGSIQHLTVHDSPASNGVAERANRTHLYGTRAILEGAKLPKYLWAEAVSHHVWLHNQVPTCTLYESKTPIEMGTNQKPDLSIVCPWGCKMWIKRLDVRKLKPCAEECRFVGVDSESKGYRVYWPGKNHVSVERDAYFNEKEALEPDEVSIDEENDLPTNLDHHQHLDNPSKTPLMNPINLLCNLEHKSLNHHTQTKNRHIETH